MVTAAELASLEPVTDKDTDERYYPYPPNGKQLDSVTYLIGATQSKPWYRTWYATSALGWAADNLELFLKTLETQGRKAAIDLGKDAAEQTRLIKAHCGIYVHDVVEALTLWAASPGGAGSSVALPLLPDHLTTALYDGEPLPVIAEFMVDGFINFISAFSSPKIIAAEMKVYHEPLGIAGTLDLILELTGYAISYGTGRDGADEIVACPGNVLVICIDVKTGKDPEATWKEQLAAYRRMLECLVGLGELRPMPRTDCGAVLHLRPEYPEGFLLQLVSAKDDEPAWGRFLAMAAGHKERQKVKGKPGPSIRPLRPDGTMPGLRICDMAGEGWGRALAPLAKALGADAELEQVARFTDAELRAVKGIGPKLAEVIRAMLAGHGFARPEPPSLADQLKASLEASLAAQGVA
jgi:hypothetical protein